MLYKLLMKSYVIDQLRPADYEKIKICLNERYGPADLGGIYWLPMDSSIYSTVQASHIQCRPFYFALDLEPDKLACELLVRTKHRIRCECICYASETQRNWLIQTVDAMFSDLDITV